jgi:hypothetical protein
LEAIHAFNALKAIASGAIGTALALIGGILSSLELSVPTHCVCTAQSGLLNLCAIETPAVFPGDFNCMNALGQAPWDPVDAALPGIAIGLVVAGVLASVLLGTFLLIVSPERRQKLLKRGLFSSYFSLLFGNLG